LPLVNRVVAGFGGQQEQESRVPANGREACRGAQPRYVAGAFLLARVRAGAGLDAPNHAQHNEQAVATQLIDSKTKDKKNPFLTPMCEGGW
jgi:hypothetical protein